MKRLRLILGDQLNQQHSWFEETCDSTTYLIAEVIEEATYARHHIQKTTGIFAAMAAFAAHLQSCQHTVMYLTLDDTSQHDNFPALLKALFDTHRFDCFEYQRPDEHRLLVQLRDLRLPDVTIKEHDSEHFLVPFEDIGKDFKAGTSVRMENFYRKMRRRFDLLMEGDEPEGGMWNYDGDNRNKLKKTDLDLIPAPLLFANDVEAIRRRLTQHDIATIGELDGHLPWPINRAQSVELLAHFCQTGLPYFGQFQDAMTDQHNHSWSLFHSRLSFALNTKILHPMEVMQAAIAAFRSNDAISIQQIEGFVRQILGWREFVRGIYWINMPDYAHLNHLNAKRNLPAFFWTGDTDLNCLKQAIDQSLTHGYAHHIQRLMITGNFCLIAGIDPSEVDAWYLGIYVDAFEWVELPNTRGMSQFADGGGLVGSKPYAASGNYVNKMSDYCRDCRYNVREKTGDNACPLNALYWHFMERHRHTLEKNPRIGMVYRNWDKQDKAARQQTLDQAVSFLANLN